MLAYHYGEAIDLARAAGVETEPMEEPARLRSVPRVTGRSRSTHTSGEALLRARARAVARRRPE